MDVIISKLDDIKGTSFISNPKNDRSINNIKTYTENYSVIWNICLVYILQKTTFL